MQLKNSLSIFTIFFFFLFLSFSVFAQDAAVKPNPEKKDDKSPTSSPTPAAKPTPVLTSLQNFMEQPDYKAYMAAMAEKDMIKRIPLLEKFLSDFPNSANINLIN